MISPLSLLDLNEILLLYLPHVFVFFEKGNLLISNSFTSR